MSVIKVRCSVVGLRDAHSSVYVIRSSLVISLEGCYVVFSRFFYVFFVDDFMLSFGGIL